MAMPIEINLENTGKLGRKLQVKLPAKEVDSKEELKIQEYSKHADVKGFRKGHVPVTLVKQRFGAQARKEVVAGLIEESLTEALTKEKLSPADRPNITDINDKKGEDLSYTVTLEIMPEIELQDYAKIKVEKLKAKVDEKDINDTIKKLQDQFASWDVKKGKASKGDRVVIDFEGFIDGKAFENGAANDHNLELGSNTFIPGFEDGLIGSSADEDKEVKVKFPKDYGASDLAGKDAVFKVKVKKVEKKKPAEIDSEFAKKIGVEDGNVEEINAKIEESLKDHTLEIIETKLRDAVLDKLLDLHKFDIPDALLSREVRALKQELQQRQVLDESEDNINKQAEKRVKIALLLQAIVKKHDLKPDPKRIDDKINKLAAMFGQADFVKKMYYESEELMQGINNTVLTDQATEVVLENATVTEKEISFKELTK